MVAAITSALGVIVSYFLGIFGNDKLFYPGFDAPFVAWKLLFAFIVVGGVFLAQMRIGLLAVFAAGIVFSALFALNYGSLHAIPPIWSATDTAWFSFQLGQSCFVGVAARLLQSPLIAALKGKKDDDGKDS